MNQCTSTGGGAAPPLNSPPGAGLLPHAPLLPGAGGGTAPPVSLGPPPGVTPHARSLPPLPSAGGGTAGPAVPIPHSFHGRDVSVLTPRQMGAWRTGHWRREWHNRRFGWWWNVGPSWFLYPEPVYPHPPYISEVIVEQGYPNAGYWYYCDDPPGFYTYVQFCWYPWRAVPIEPQ